MGVGMNVFFITRLYFTKHISDIISTREKENDLRVFWSLKHIIYIFICFFVNIFTTLHDSWIQMKVTTIHTSYMEVVFFWRDMSPDKPLNDPLNKINDLTNNLVPNFTWDIPFLLFYLIIVVVRVLRPFTT